MTTHSDAFVWTAVIAIGIGTFLLRYTFFALIGRVATIPALAQRALRLVPASVLAALVTPALFYRDGAFDPWNERLLAGTIAALVAVWTKNVLATLVSGMAVLWLLQALV